MDDAVVDGEVRVQLLTVTDGRDAFRRRVGVRRAVVSNVVDGRLATGTLLVCPAEGRIRVDLRARDDCLVGQVDPFMIGVGLVGGGARTGVGAEERVPALAAGPDPVPAVAGVAAPELGVGQAHGATLVIVAGLEKVLPQSVDFTTPTPSTWWPLSSNCP